MRRTWLRKLVDVTKRYLIAAAAHNLGRILRKLFGVGKPRALQGGLGLPALAHFVMTLLLATQACPSASHPTRRFARAGVTIARWRVPNHAKFNGLLARTP